MATTVVRGSTTVKRLRQGDTLTSMLMSTRSLVQYVNKVNNSVNPDWTIPGLSQPIIYPSIRSNLSTMFITGTNIIDAEWFYDGVKIEAGNPNFTILPNHPGPGGEVPGLKITGNIMQNVTTAKTIRLECKVKSGGAITPVIATIDVQRQEISETTYVGEISAANGGSVTEDNKTETLSGLLMKGGQVVPNYTVQWWRIVGFDTDGEVDGMVNTLKTSDQDTNVTFHADEIHLFETIVAKFFVEGVQVAMASIDIIDLTDPYEMRFTHDPATGIADEGGTVTTWPRVVKVGTDETIASFTKYAFTLRNDLHMIRNQLKGVDDPTSFVTKYSDFEEKKDEEGVVVAQDTDVLTLTVETQDTW